MARFAKILGRIERFLLFAEFAADALPLRQHQAFAAFPGLEAAALHQLIGVMRLAEGNEFQREIVAAVYQIAMLFEFLEAVAPVHAQALPELIALVEDAGIIGFGGEGAIISGARFGGIV